MAFNNSRHTLRAAIGRRDRDSRIAGAETEQEKQGMVSQNLHEKAVGEGRYCPGEGQEGLEEDD